MPPKVTLPNIFVLLPLKGRVRSINQTLISLEVPKATLLPSYILPQSEQHCGDKVPLYNQVPSNLVYKESTFRLRIRLIDRCCQIH